MPVKTSVVSVLFFAALCAPGFGYNVLWDTSHGVADPYSDGGYQPSAYYSALATLLAGNGFTVNTTSLGFTDTNLAATDVAVVCLTSAYNSSYTTTQANALADFVDDGGGLLIMGGHPFLLGGNSNIQPVADKFGITLATSGDTYTYSGNPTLEALEHPVFAGFTETDDIYIPLSGEMTIDENSFALAQDPTTEEILIAGANYGTGRLIALGDFNMFAISTVVNGLDQDENRDFAVNTFEWLAVPEPTTLPDLFVNSLTIDTNPIVQPQSTTIRCTIKNQGTADATPTGYWLRVRLSADNVYDESDTYIAGRQITINLGPGEQRIETFNFNSGGYDTGSFYLVAMVDAYNIVTESAENNNTASLPFTIEPNNGHTVHGYVKYSNDNGFGGRKVTLTGNGENLTDYTQADGYYHFDGLADGSYTVTAEESGGWTFTNNPQYPQVSGSNVWLLDMIGSLEVISQPSIPNGEISPLQGTSYTYTTSGSTSNKGHTIEYQFNWGDGISAWSTSTNASHTWIDTGQYIVVVTARCQIHTDASHTSEGLTINVSSGEVISKPGTLTGQTEPIVNLTYTYTTSGAESNLGHTIEYQFDWDDGSFSGWSTSTSASHLWDSTVSRTVMVTARCQSHIDKTNTSDSLTISPLVTDDTGDGLIWSAKAIGADKLHDLGISGEDVFVGSVELGEAYAEHEVFAVNRLTNLPHLLVPPGDYRHATQVAGVTGGNSSSYIGVAPNTKLLVNNLGPFGSLSVAQGVEELAETEDIVNVEIQLEFGVPWPPLDLAELAMDFAVCNKGVTVVVAAGNHETNIRVPAGAYNSMTVGATEDFREFPGGPAYPLSARKYLEGNFGPTSDGRCKPDIVAPGVAIEVPLENGDYSTASGTSFAAPHVAGAAALLIEQGYDMFLSRDPKVLKALIMTGTIKPISWSRSSIIMTAGENIWQETTQPLDLALGSGLVNVEHASQIYAGGYQPSDAPAFLTDWQGWDDSHIDLTSTPATYLLGERQIPADTVITGTLVWNRNVLQNNVAENLDVLALTLSSYRTGSWSVVASSISTIDNVQYIYYRIPYGTPSRQYRLQVHYGSDNDSIPGCEYALAWNVDQTAWPAIENGFFSNGTLYGWSLSGGAMRETEAREYCDADPYAAKLTVPPSETYVELSQVTKQVSFTDGILEFGFVFKEGYTSPAFLNIYCDGQLKDSYGAPGGGLSRMNWVGVDLHFQSPCLTHNLVFRLEAAEGVTVLLDSIQLSPIIEDETDGDIDDNGFVNVHDLVILTNQWLQIPGSPSADIAPGYGDCMVDFLDFTEIAEHWFEGLSP